MPLYVIATPIGVGTDISQRAVETIRSCDAIIGEEYKNASRLLKFCQAEGKEIYILNEHSKPDDLTELCELAKTQSVALVSDCGTPGFCDPGADLVQLCRKRGVEVKSRPGPSSLMTFLSICGHRLDQFMFRGFLPAENQQRRKEFEKLRESKTPVILMDTPYRLKKSLDEIKELLPQRKLVLGLDLSTDIECVMEGTADSILKSLRVEKAEFLLLMLP